MLYNLDIDIGVYYLFLILCCPVYMVHSCKTNTWCFIVDFILPLPKILPQVGGEMVNGSVLPVKDASVVQHNGHFHWYTSQFISSKAS